MEQIDSFPLQWPEGWRRTLKPVRSQFKNPSVANAINQILHQLHMMGYPSWNVIVSTNIKTKRDGMPYSNQREPEDAGVSVWFRGDGDFERKVLAVDKYDRVGCNLWAIHKTLEAMRGIERWGSSEILERTFQGFDALPNPDTIKWWHVLGCAA